MEVSVEDDPVLMPPDPIIAGGPPGGSAKLLLERAKPVPLELKINDVTKILISICMIRSCGLSQKLISVLSNHYTYPNEKGSIFFFNLYCSILICIMIEDCIYNEDGFS